MSGSDPDSDPDNVHWMTRAGLILIYRFPPSLLFQNHRSLPVPIRGYHLQTLLTLPWLPYTSFLHPLFLPSLFPPFHPYLPSPISLLLHMPIISPYSCYIDLCCTISTYTGFATLATSHFRYRSSAMLTSMTLRHVHTNIRQIWQTTDVEQCGFKPCRC